MRGWIDKADEGVFGATFGADEMGMMKSWEGRLYITQLRLGAGVDTPNGTF